MRLRWSAFIAAFACLAAAPPDAVLAGPSMSPNAGLPALARPVVPIARGDDDYDIDLIVALSGRCTVFRVAGQNLPCRAVKYFHGESGRAYFTVAVDDPADKGRIVSFSGDKARRERNDFYELTVDQVLLNSKERPLAGGVRVPRVEPASGSCKQIGDIDSKQIKSVSCTATDRAGRAYELQFEADGEPATVQKITREPLESVRRRARLRALKTCRVKAAEAQILPRDAAAYIINCLEQGGVSPVSGDQ
ncbi:hypothetical protein [Bradyrhizobium sp.]|uniref:hypothetical protein n=1 Tax=Bradyrhizobium sp. TaxID=376 RepID=UPI0040384164